MNTNALTPVEKIEYYLGKDSLPNLHWKSELPKMWAISARQNTYIHQQKENIANQIVIDPVTQTTYKFNNLGYRNNFDYTDDLKNKKVVLMLGCSDTFGRFVDYSKIYCSLLQQRMGNDYVVCNMGVPGGSPDQSVRIGTQMIGYLGSAVTHLPLPRSEAYGSSKAALDYLVATLAIRLQAKGILLTLVRPGFVKTPLTDKNNFPMPWLCTPEQASHLIRIGIEHRKQIIQFPFQLHCWMRLFRILPANWWRWLAQKILVRSVERK